jgi:hypothetical protein
MLSFLQVSRTREFCFRTGVVRAESHESVNAFCILCEIFLRPGGDFDLSR